jgi:phosphoribosyl 1,2-cyclic phosphate phosphodiesterase
MKITILGSGTSTGVPMVGCHCPVCTSSDPKDRRTRASLLVEHDGKFILIDTSPDLRSQALRTGIPRIDAVLFTHTHADHVNGIDDLRGYYLIHREVIPCYGTGETIEHISRCFGYIFAGAQDGWYSPLLEPHEIVGPFEVFGLEIIPVPLVHGSAFTTGFRIGSTAYLTDCSLIPTDSLELLSGLDVLILDALRYTPHASHFNIDGALQVAEQLRPCRTILTHLTHEVACRDAEKLPQGVEFAYDGMFFESYQPSLLRQNDKHGALNERVKCEKTFACTD